MAAPQVTGTVALILAAKTLGRRPKPGQVAAQLKRTATPGDSPTIYGHGRLNAGAALTTPAAR